VETPEVQYAKSGDVSVAYAVVGDGPFDLVFVNGRRLPSSIAYEETPGPQLPPIAVTLTKIERLLRGGDERKKPTKAEREEMNARHARVLVNAEPTRKLAERA
jgi:hypothetical protein